jgi:hypothetical protein
MYLYATFNCGVLETFCGQAGQLVTLEVVLCFFFFFFLKCPRKRRKKIRTSDLRFMRRRDLQPIEVVGRNNTYYFSNPLNHIYLMIHEVPISNFFLIMII